MNVSTSSERSVNLKIEGLSLPKADDLVTLFRHGPAAIEGLPKGRGEPETVFDQEALAVFSTVADLITEEIRHARKS